MATGGKDSDSWMIAVVILLILFVLWWFNWWPMTLLPSGWQHQSSSGFCGATCGAGWDPLAASQAEALAHAGALNVPTPGDTRLHTAGY